MAESSRLAVELTVTISRAKAQRLVDTALAVLSSGADMGGVCVQCEEESDLTEPHARRHKCEACGEFNVMGAEEILVQLENML